MRFAESKSHKLGLDALFIEKYPTGTHFDDFVTFVYPNPTRGILNLTYFLPEKDVVEINLYDLSGRIIKEVLVDEKERGNYSMQLNFNELVGSYGIYILEFQTSEATVVRKLAYQE